MKNLEKKSTKLDPIELITMVGLIRGEFPEITEGNDLADLVSEHFDVQVTAEDIQIYNNHSQDWELESRRAIYGHYH